jgi:hypothetical protein
MDSIGVDTVNDGKIDSHHDLAAVGDRVGGVPMVVLLQRCCV